MKHAPRESSPADHKPSEAVGIANCPHFLKRAFTVFLAASWLLFSGTAAVAALGARNVVLVIGDGMGFNQVTAADYYLWGRDGAAPFESLPVRLAMSTYPAGGSYSPTSAWNSFSWVLGNPTDSAAAATAMATGRKTVVGAVGVSPTGTVLRDLVEAAEATGRRTGLVTSVTISDATPAAFAAHWPDRSDHYRIARQMILGSGLDVLMGAGNPWYDNDARRVSSPLGYEYVGGARLWNRLRAGTAGGDADGDGIRDPWTLVETRAAFRSLATGIAPKRVLGVARVHDTLQQARSGDAYAPPGVIPLNAGVPTLREMTLGALNVLSAGPGGFFLMVEGGAIDHAGHSQQSGRLIEEERDLDLAVSAVKRWVIDHSSWGETLLIVVADHETGYLNGPGSDPDWNPLVNYGQGAVPGMEWHTVGHTNSLVGAWARGPGADLLTQRATGSDPIRGAYLDNTDIGRVIFSVLQ